MELRIGQKVSYPNQGICLVEKTTGMTIAGTSISCYLLRLLSDNSTILVPVSKADNIGIRPVIGRSQFRRLMDNLGSDFEDVSGDWKTRSRQFQEKLQTGDVFQAADVLKKLTYLSHEKKLSFREQTMLEKARYLIVSEIVNADCGKDSQIESKVKELVERACTMHVQSHPQADTVTIH